MDTIITNNPWLGLESYKEGQILYGRDDDIRDLSQSILNDTDTLLYGKSGIGKSSILNAGILPAARRHGYLPVVIRLSHKGADSYLYQIHQAILNAISAVSDQQSSLVNEESLIREIVPCKDSVRESLYEYFHRHTFHDSEGRLLKLLIIYDQFEEIFTLQESTHQKKKFFLHLADLLNDVMPDELQQKVEMSSSDQMEVDLLSEDNFHTLFDDLNLNVENNLPEYISDLEHHFVFTIREDFLSEFEYYSANIPSLKQNRYNLRPINEEQAAQIILRPMPGLIDLSVAKLIIQKVTGKSDFDLDGIPEIEVDSAVLSLYLNRLYDAKEGDSVTEKLVEDKGGEIISDFYIDALSNVSESTIEYLEDMLLNGQGRRDNITIYDAKNDGRISDEELDILCNQKKILRQFNYAGDLRIEYVHDILCPVVKEHKEERLAIKQQEEERKRELEERRMILLQEEQKRKEIELRAAVEKRKLEEEAKEIKRKNKQKFLLIYCAFNLLVFVGLGWWFLWERPYSEYYASFTTVNGWPNGLGEKLNPKNSELNKHLINYYKLTRKGLLGGNKFSKVEVFNTEGRSANNLFYHQPVVGLIETELSDARAREFSLLQRSASMWVYMSNSENSEVASRCIAYDINNNELYSIDYYRDITYDSSDRNKYVQWAVFKDANGRQLIVTDNGIDRMRQTIDNGIVTSCLFFTQLGVPQKNVLGKYGYNYSVNDSTKLIHKITDVDKFGTLIDSSTVSYKYNKYARVDITSTYIADYSNHGMILRRYDNHIDTLLFHGNGTIKYGNLNVCSDGITKVIFEYDNNCKLKKRYKYNGDALTESRDYKYLSHSDKVEECLCYDNGKSYTERYEYPNDSVVVQSFWNADVKVVCSRTIDAWKNPIVYHQRKTTISQDSLYNIEVVEFRDVDGNLTESANGCAKYTIVNDRATGNPKLKYHYDSKNLICKSEWNEYDEYGNRIARSVAGIDGTPVRSADWDWDGFCYYKMAVLKDFGDKSYLAIKGLNEFNEPSYVIYKEDLYELSELPMQREMVPVAESENAYKYVITLSSELVEPIGNRQQVPYIHITDKNGSVYQMRSRSDSTKCNDYLRDGDIIYQIGMWKLYDSEKVLQSEWNRLRYHGGTIKVLRISDNAFVDFTFALPKGYLGAKYYMMPLTKLESDRLNRTSY